MNILEKLRHLESSSKQTLINLKISESIIPIWPSIMIKIIFKTDFS